MAQTRMTKQRTAILDALRSVKTHPTADEVYAMVRVSLPHISLGTVYRNLDLLAESGEILRLEKSGTQKRFDGDIRPHFHIRCEHCGKIGDVYTQIPLPVCEGITVEGFASIHFMDLVFSGVCWECKGAGRPQDM